MQLRVLETTTNYQFLKKAGKPYLVLLHGWLQDWQTFSPVISQLSKDFQLVLPDLPGFGASQLEAESWTSEQYARWLHGLIDQLELDPKLPLFVGGHSFGAKISALYAAQYGRTNRQLSGLILISSAGLPDPLPVSASLKQNLLKLVPGLIKDLLPADLKRRALEKTNLATDHLMSSPQQQAILKLTVRENIGASLGRITLPTLIIWGDQDHTTPLHQAYEFHLKIAGSRLAVLAGGNHFPFANDPRWFVKTIGEFAKS